MKRYVHTPKFKRLVKKLKKRKGIKSPYAVAMSRLGKAQSLRRRKQYLRKDEYLDEYGRIRRYK